MIQGTTPKLRLRFPFDARLLDTINVTFVDGSVGTPEIVLTKALTFDIIDSETVDIDIPLIIGGGIRTPEAAAAAREAGADIIVTGTLLEQCSDGSKLKAVVSAAKGA